MERYGRFLPWFGGAFVASCVIGGVAAYLVKNNDASVPATIELSIQEIKNASAANRAHLENGSQTLPPTAPPPQPPQLVEVDSYPAENMSPLVDWPQISGTYGYMDAVAIGGDNPTALTARQLNNDDVLTASGWAGHQLLGMSMSKVVLAVCDKIVANVAVKNARPDVAKAVHPYLENSGWSARLAVAHLPRCEGAVLSAFALGPKGPNLWPLAQSFALNLPPKNEAKAALFSSRADVLERSMRQLPQSQKITINASTLRVRSCGGAQCTVMGRVAKGVYSGFVVEHRDGWALIQLPTVSGWLSEKHIRVGG
ncbi:hypothetical protein [Magnetovibrio sp.]|uniref:hypothetical protein n=1 Tax=Magnetovibrio sp. TaxID=2024836 RepID=UPI002F937BFD